MKPLRLLGAACSVRRPPVVVLIVVLSVGGTPVRAHFTGETAHDELARMVAQELAAEQVAATRESARRPGPWRVAQVRTARPAAEAGAGATPRTAEIFAAFAPAVRVRWDERFLFVESNGLPAHGMMAGITAWQQQVPLPQPYNGNNAWQIPLHPVVASSPVSIKGRFLRGAIAVAANGVPIFNPQNNRGEVSQEIGELDEWGGHCGRADDYHYHAAPFHLQSVVGPGRPIAYALDGYPILGVTEPDGTKPAKLDAYNGHETAALGYHYHGSTQYPYVNGGFHGVVVEREGQVDPQPRATGVRPALTALRGARIVRFEGVPGQTKCTLSYTVNGKPAAVAYESLGGGQWRFQFTQTDGSIREEIFRAGERGGGGGGGGGRDGKKKNGGTPKGKGPPRETEKELGAAPDFVPRRSGAFALRCPAVGPDGLLPMEFTGDGASVSPPLEWSGAPTGTRSFAVIMHHLAPDGEVKWYWTLYNLPAAATGVPKDTHGVGTLGSNSVTRRAGYAPPHSKGPGAKTYVLTAYALSAPLQLTMPAAQVSRNTLLTAMKDLILDSAELKVTYTRPVGADDDSPSDKKKGKRA